MFARIRVQVKKMGGSLKLQEPMGSGSALPYATGLHADAEVLRVVHRTQGSLGRKAFAGNLDFKLSRLDEVDRHTFAG